MLGLILSPLARVLGGLVLAGGLLAGAYVMGDRNGYARALAQRAESQAKAAAEAERVEDEIDDLDGVGLFDEILRRPR